jgi:hypothetical protein
MNKSIEVSIRKDRLGSIFCSMLGDFIYIKNKNYIPIYPSTFKNNSFFIKVLQKFMEEKNNNHIILNKNHSGIRQNQIFPVTELKQDLVSYFKEYYFNKFFFELKKYTINFKLPWNNNENIICIHIRLDDVINNKDYDGTGSANYINNLIENNKPFDYIREDMLKCSPDVQTPIEPKKLRNLLIKLKNHYPNKEIHIVKYGILNDSYNKIIKEFNIKVHQNEPDYDLWLLINSNILVLSKSTFSQVAMYFHTGTKIYAPLWGMGVSNGTMSKYNKTNIEFYI